MNQNLDHASHVREHQKKTYEQGKNVFFSPISTRGKKLFATREKKILLHKKYNEIRKKFLYNRLAGQSLLYGSRRWKYPILYYWCGEHKEKTTEIRV